MPLNSYNDKVYIKNIVLNSTVTHNNIVVYNSSKSRITGVSISTENTAVEFVDGVYIISINQMTANSDVAWFRFCAGTITDDTIVTVNEEINEVEPTNFADPNTTNTTDWSIWCNNARFGSDGTYRSNSGTVVTNYVPIQVGDTLYFEGLNVATTGTSMTNGLAFYDGEKDIIAPSYLSWYIDEEDYATLDVTDGAYTIEILDAFSSYINGTYGGKGSETAFVRIAGALTGTVNDVVIKVKRNGKWL